MTFPIQRQSETYGAFDDGDLRFAKEYTTRDLPEGLANMLGGPRISAGLNDPRRMQREADLGDAWNAITDIPDKFDAGGTAATGGVWNNVGDMFKGFGGGFAAMPDAVGDVGNALTQDNVTQGKAVPEPAPATTNINAHRQGGYRGENDYGPAGPSVPPEYWAEDSPAANNEPPAPWDREPPTHESDGYPVDEHALREQLRPDATGGRGFPAGGHGPYDPAEWNDDVGPMPHDYLAQFRPHLASFTEARSQHTAEDGPAPGLFAPNLFQPGERLDARSTMLGGEKAFVDKDHPVAADGDWVTAAAVQPQVVPGWIGHGYAPGHRVGLPWREQVIPGTVTHLDGQDVGIRWDDGQHSTEEPKDLRPL